MDQIRLKTKSVPILIKSAERVWKRKMLSDGADGGEADSWCHGCRTAADKLGCCDSKQTPAAKHPSSACHPRAQGPTTGL